MWRPVVAAARTPDKVARFFIPTRRQRKVILSETLDEEPNPPSAVNEGPAALGVRSLLPRPADVRAPRPKAGLGGHELPASNPHADWRALALGLGFARVGVAQVNGETLAREAEAKAATQRWVEAKLHAQLDYMTTSRSSPGDLLPEAKSVVVVVAPTEDVAATKPKINAGRIAAYARGLDYHGVLKSKLWLVAQQLCDDLQCPIRARVCVDTAPVLERFWAAEAGVTFTGKSTMAIAPGVGSNVLLGLLLVDVALPSSSRLPAGCGECTLCLDACPTQAFPMPFVLDAGRCIATLTIENPGPIPPALRPALADRVFGCDECQTVCPYNSSRKRPGALPELAALPERSQPDLHRWATLTSGDYKRLTKHSALRRAPRAQLQRNAVVALGNTVHPTAEDVTVLTGVLHGNPNPLVREHAAWALAQLQPGDVALPTAVLHTVSHTVPDTDRLVAECETSVRETEPARG